MTTTDAIPADVEDVAWNCHAWPEWLHDLVAQTNDVADRLDMSTEQAVAYAALLSRAPVDGAEPVAWGVWKNKGHGVFYQSKSVADALATKLRPSFGVYTVPPAPAASPASGVGVEPYAYEYGRSNGDGTFSVVIERREPCNPVTDWPIKPLYASLVEPQPAPSPAQPVSSIVPPHCTGSAFAFEPGVLRVNKDGSGYIAINEDDFDLEDDCCEGPDGPEGSVHWITRLPASEMTALRDFLNGAPRAPASPDADLVRAAEKLCEQVEVLLSADEDLSAQTAQSDIEDTDKALAEFRALLSKHGGNDA